MPSKEPKKPAKYIVPLNMNGMRGRMLRMLPPKRNRRELLLVYGHQASLEQFFHLADALNDYAGVTIPDMPGFGGMDSFYKIGEKPTLDKMADYLATFVKLRYRNRRFTIAGVGYGFLVVTRMLQRYPDLTKKVDIAISISGLTKYDELTLSKMKRQLYNAVARTLSSRVASAFSRNLVMHPSMMRIYYDRLYRTNKLQNLGTKELPKLIDKKINLWRINDTRTHMFTTSSLLKADTCQDRLNLPVIHIDFNGGRYVDNNTVEQHMRVIFTDYRHFIAESAPNAFSLLATKRSAKNAIPKDLKALLRKAVS